jgi:hypothetical protein
MASALRPNTTNRLAHLLEWGAVLLLALYCAWMVIRSTEGGGLHYTPDSINFLSAARTLVNGEGLWRITRIPFTSWPPIMPVALGAYDLLTRWTGQDMLERVRYFNALLYGLTVIAAWRLFRPYTQSRWVLLLGLLLTVLAAPITRVFTILWTEGPFMLLVIGYLWALSRLVDQPGLGRLAVMIVMTIACTMLRLAGIGLVPIAALAILLFMHQAGWRQRLLYAGLTLLAAIPYVLWLAYGLSLPRPAVFPWESVGEALANVWLNVTLTPSLMAGWFGLAAGPVSSLVAVVLVVGGIVTAALVYWRLGRAGQFPAASAFPIIPALYVPLYILNLYAGQFTVRTTDIDLRHFSVLIIPCALLLVGLVDHGLRQPLARPLRLGIGAAALIWAGWASLGSFRTAEVQAAALSRANLERTDSLVVALRQSPVDGRVYSNTPYPLLYTAQVVQTAPLTVDDWLPILQAAGGRPVYFVWYTDGDSYSPNLDLYYFNLDYTLADLERVAQVEVLTTTDRGRILRLRGE